MMTGSTAPTPISAATLTELLGAIGEKHPQAPTVAPLITRAAHPSLRREVPVVVAEAVRNARKRQTRESRLPDRRPAVFAGPTPIVPRNLSGLLGLPTREPADRSAAGPTAEPPQRQGN